MTQPVDFAVFDRFQTTKDSEGERGEMLALHVQGGGNQRFYKGRKALRKITSSKIISWSFRQEGHCYLQR